MLTPNQATPEDVKRVLLECEEFNKDHKTIQEIEQELGIEVNAETAERISKAINMSRNLQELKQLIS